MVSKNRNWQHHLSGIRPRLIAEFDIVVTQLKHNIKTTYKNYTNQ